MRKFKFRAWVKTDDMFNGVMVYQNDDTDFCMICNGDGFSIVYQDEEWIKDSAFQIMQYTGKYDSKRTNEFPKGQEVYESDIIECEYYNGEIWRGTVKWGFGEPSFFVLRDNDSCKCYSVNFSGSAVKRWEVIGNIHQNPELLVEGCE